MPPKVHATLHRANHALKEVQSWVGRFERSANDASFTKIESIHSGTAAIMPAERCTISADFSSAMAACSAASTCFPAASKLSLIVAFIVARSSGSARRESEGTGRPGK